MFASLTHPPTYILMPQSFQNRVDHIATHKSINASDTKYSNAPQNDANNQPSKYDFKPAQNDFKPSQNDFKPAQTDFRPAKNDFKLEQSDPKPAPNDFRSAQHNLKPAQNDFKPAQKNLKPTQNNFRPVQNDFKPAQNDFKPAQNDFKPTQNDFRPAQNDFKSAQNDFKETQNNSKRSENDSESDNREVILRIDANAEENEVRGQADEPRYVVEMRRRHEVVQEMEARNRWRLLRLQTPDKDLASLKRKMHLASKKHQIDVFYDHEGRYQRERAGIYLTSYRPELLAADLDRSEGTGFFSSKIFTAVKESHLGANQFSAALNEEMAELRRHSRTFGVPQM